MPFEIKSDTTALEIFTVAYDSTSTLISHIQESREKVGSHSDNIPGTPLRVSYAGSRIWETKGWHMRSRIEVIIPELGSLGKISLLERTITTASGIEEPYSVSAWRGSESRGDYQLTHDCISERVKASVGSSGYYDTDHEPEHPELLNPQRGLVERTMQGDGTVWIPGAALSVNVQRTERSRLRLAASRVLEMVDAIELLLEGEETFGVMGSLGYLWSKKQLRALREAKLTAEEGVPVPR